MLDVAYLLLSRQESHSGIIAMLIEKISAWPVPTAKRKSYKMCAPVAKALWSTGTSVVRVSLSLCVSTHTLSVLYILLELLSVCVVPIA